MKRFCDMKPVLIIWAAGALLFPALCFASEEYDPLLYPEAAAAEADAAAMPSSGETLLASPKLLDEEDMNFENLDFDALDGEPQSTPMPAAAPSAVTPPPPPASSSLPAAPAGKETAPVVDKNKTLTDNLQANAPSTEDSVIPLPKVEETWISKIKSPLGEADSAKAAGDEEKQTGKVNLENLVEKSKKTVRRSNASVFDISGAMLRMSFKQIDDILTRRGFRRTVQKLDIPNFIRWRNEDKCRASGVVGYERLENCVIQMAKKNGYQYVERTTYSKFDTREEIEVYFTSTFTNNKAYRISYKSEAATAITGNSQKQIYLRNIKVYDFWKKINQKYGTPDNKDDVIWGLGGNKPYLQAGTGRLILEDPMLRELDYTRMSREDQKFMNTDLYSF